MAVKDLKNELVYLYEIRDAILAQFGSKKTALKQLGVSDEDWNVLGDLANNQPLIQGPL